VEAITVAGGGHHVTPDSVAGRVHVSKWSGWGALPEVFDPSPGPRWARRTRAWIEDRLDVREMRAARRSILNAHYTTPDLAQRIWELARAVGWRGGPVLEPGCGIGVFMATAPTEADVVGIEIDPVTARLAAALHREVHTVVNESLESFQLQDGSMSLAIGNVPFADVVPTDPALNQRRNLSLHNYAIVKALAGVEPGGPVIVITSPYTLDAANPAARLEIARYGEYVGSLRLPELAFRRHSGTSVTTDVVVLRRRDRVLSVHEAREATAGQPWLQVHTIAVTDTSTGAADQVTVNATYGAATQANIAGGITTGGMYRHDSCRVVVDPDHYGQALDRAFAALTSTAAARFTPPSRTAAPARIQPPTPHTGPGVPVEQHPQAGPVAPAESRPDASAGVLVEPHLPVGRAGDGIPGPPPWVKPGGLFGARSTGFWQRSPGGEVRRFEPSPKKDARVLEAYLRLRDAYLALVDAELDSSDDGHLSALRQELNTHYDTVVRVLGQPLNHHRETVDRNGVTSRRYPPLGGARRHDPDYHAVLGLEHYDPDTGTAAKAAIFTSRQIRAPRRVERCDTVEEALAVSLAETGTPDLARIAALLAVDPEVAAGQLAGHAFLDDDHTDDRWVPAAAYLSGDVRAKHHSATERAATDPRFAANVAALAGVIPAAVEPEEISVQLGAPWLTAGEVTAFLEDTLGASLESCRIVFHPAVGWRMTFPSYLEAGEAMTGTYGTDDLSALKIAATALEGRPIRVMRTVEGADGRERRVLDRAATINANAKLDELNTALAAWVRDDPERASILAERYNRLFRSHAAPSYPPMWPRPPGLAAHIELRDHQNSALTRALLTGSVGLFHAVGAGKTITMASIAVELRRIGLARKPLLVVPNHLLTQIAADIHRAYPAASVLLPTDRSVKGRANLVSSIAAGDWDAVVFSYEMFKAIPVSTEAEIAYLESRSDELRDALGAVRDADGGRGRGRGAGRTVRQIEKLIARFEERIKDLRAKPRDPTLTFESLGVDALVCDEAHYAKNLVLGGTNSGVAARPSQRALDLDLKIQLLRQLSDGGVPRLVLSTGTPVSNSFAELWVMMRYLQPEVLEAANVARFDEFVAQFGRIVTELELHPTGTYRLTSRLAEFRNVPELQLLFSQSADVRLAGDLDLDLPELAGGSRQAVVVPASPELQGFVASLARRAELLDRSRPDEDNMLKIYSDGRAAALSLQLVDRPDPTPSKLDLAAEQILATWHRTRTTTYLDPRTGQPHTIPGALQIVFMDQGVPTSSAAHGVNLYEQLRQLLVQGGMPPDGIVFIHDADDNEKLFDRCRQGHVSVLIGSTEKMGTGMNVQTRAASLIHMDPTWRPADMEQREGRILRQGNQNPTVTIYNMLAEGSTDTLLYQGLERKARMITQVLSGTNAARTVNDIDAAVVQFGDMKALATGNPLVVEQLDLKRRINELEIRQQAWTQRAARLTKGVPIWQQRQTQLETRIAALQRLHDDAPTLQLNTWPITCFDQPATAPADADQRLRARARNIPYRSLGNRSAQPATIGALGPWPIRAILHHDTLDVTIDAAPYDLTFDLTIPADDLSPYSTTRIWQRIINRPLRSLSDRIDLDTHDLRRTRSDLDQAARYAGKPFTDQHLLDDLRGRLAQVEDQLTPDPALEASPDPEADPEPFPGPRLDSEPFPGPRPDSEPFPGPEAAMDAGSGNGSRPPPAARSGRGLTGRVARPDPTVDL
jgi:N12 class adenine-specific DNA methylase